MPTCCREAQGGGGAEAAAPLCCRSCCALLQARESCQLLERLADEQGPVSVYAYGVGRGVDASQLMNILEGAGRGDAAQRYVELCVRDEAPW